MFPFPLYVVGHLLALVATSLAASGERLGLLLKLGSCDSYKNSEAPRFYAHCLGGCEAWAKERAASPLCDAATMRKAAERPESWRYFEARASGWLPAVCWDPLSVVRLEAILEEPGDPELAHVILSLFGHAFEVANRVAKPRIALRPWCIARSDYRKPLFAVLVKLEDLQGFEEVDEYLAHVLAEVDTRGRAALAASLVWAESPDGKLEMVDLGERGERPFFRPFACWPGLTECVAPCALPNRRAKHYSVAAMLADTAPHWSLVVDASIMPLRDNLTGYQVCHLKDEPSLAAGAFLFGAERVAGDWDARGALFAIYSHLLDAPVARLGFWIDSVIVHNVDAKSARVNLTARLILENQCSLLRDCPIAAIDSQTTQDDDFQAALETMKLKGTSSLSQLV